jgi:L,D-transpeptidase catalytic domain
VCGVRKMLALALFAVLGGALAGALALGALALTAPEPVPAREGAGSERVKERTAALPEPPAPAFSVPRPRPLAAHEAGSLFAPLRRAALARAAPDAEALVVALLEKHTPEGTENIVLVLERTEDADGRLWVRVRLPVLPANTTGWVRRSALRGYGTVQTHLVVDRRRLTATLYHNGKALFRAPVGVGSEQWPTPAGHFYIRNKLTRYQSPFYGPLAFGTSARSGVLTDWPAGGFIGIHGTNEPKLLPGRVSHGCIRMHNADILRLGRLMPVGTPLTIR